MNRNSIKFGKRRLILVLIGAVFFALYRLSASQRADYGTQKSSVELAAKIAAQKEVGSIDKAKLESYAIIDGYGYKSANLMVLKDLTTKINAAFKHARLPASVAVPNFLPISTNEINTFLQQNGIDLNSLWKEFSQFKAGIKVIKGLTTQADGWLQGLERDIKSAFDTQQFTSTALVDFVKQKGNAELFMVRSTGKEDTATFANAGGNESLPARPDLGSISRAMGEVIASYFGKQSLSQRILAASDKEFDELFTETPFVPVLVQRMVGEQLGGEADFYRLPVSGVMFTQEAEGRTPGVTQIQAAFGHGEGVVNSLVAVDTYYIGSSRVIHQVIRKKMKRMVPVFSAGARKVSFEMVQNNSAVVQLQTLDAQSVRSFKIVSKEIERFYGQPMDVEFVVDQTNKVVPTIFLVQARPIVYKEGQNKPTYLQDTAALSVEYPCSIIGAAGGALLVINTMSELIIAQNLAEGLRQYIKSNAKNKIKAVITGTMAASTSHEATMLRGQGVPVIFVKDLTLLKALYPTGKNHLLIDVQREVFGMSNIYNRVNGWFAHPIPMQASLYNDGINEERWREFLQTDVTQFKADDLRQLVEFLKDCTNKEPDKAKALLAAIIKRVPEPNNIATESAKEAHAIYRYVVLCAQEIMEILPQAGQKRSLELLYAIKFLEAALFQPYNADIVRSYSLFNLVRILHRELQGKKLLIGQQGQVPVIGQQRAPDKALYLEPLMNGARAALTSVQENAWISFIRGLQAEASLQEIQDFATKSAKIQQFGAFDLYLNTDFLKLAGSVQEKLKAFNDDYESSKQCLTNLYLRRDQIKNFDVSLWEDPNNFDKQWAKLQNILVYFMGQKKGKGLYATPEFKNDFDPSGSIGKQVAISVMRELVDLFDISIKSITGSTSYPLREKVSNFAVMTQELFYLLKQWLTLNIQNPFLEAAEWINFFEEKMHKTLLQIQKNNKEYFLKKQLLVGRFLNLPSLYLGPNKPTRFDERLDRKGRGVSSMEDFFTLIHQSLLNLIAQLTIERGLLDIALPDSVRQLKQLLEKIAIVDLESSGREVRPVFLSVTMKNDSLLLKYFLSLRAHSADVSITYKKGLPIKFFIEFSGIDEGNRWGNIEKLLRVFNTRYPSMQAIIRNIAAGGVSVEWNISQDQRIDWSTIINVIQQALTISMSPVKMPPGSLWLLMYRIGANRLEVEETIKAAGSEKMPDYQSGVTRNIINAVKFSVTWPINWVVGKIYGVGNWLASFWRSSGQSPSNVARR